MKKNNLKLKVEQLKCQKKLYLDLDYLENKISSNTSDDKLSETPKNGEKY